MNRKPPKNNHYLIWQNGNRRNLQGICDVNEYANNLTDEDKTYLATFVDYHYNGNTKAGERLLGRALTKEEKKACYLRNNARNRDIMSNQGNLDYLDDNTEAVYTTDETGKCKCQKRRSTK